MKIVYNNQAIISDENIQNATLGLIYKNSDFFVSKPDFKYNLIIPDTLREYVGLVGCFKEETNSLEQFHRFLCYKISSEIDNSKLKIFKKIVNSNDEQFFKLLFNYLLEVAEQYYLDSSDEIYQLFIIKNPLNISYADLIAAFDYLDETIHVNNHVEHTFLEYLKIYASLRIKKFKCDLRKNLKLGGFVNDFNIIFRKEQSTDDRRDFKLFDLAKVHADLSAEQKIWLSFFIPIIGLYKHDYRSEVENIYERNRFSKSYTNAYFSPIYQIISVFCYNEILNNVKDDNNNLFYQEIELWLNENLHLVELFDNFLFIENFLKKLDYFSKYKIKESQGSYSSIVYDYIYKGIPYVISEIALEYPFLKNLDSENFLKNPIIKFWNDNLEQCNSIIDKIHQYDYTITYPREIIIIAQKALEKYEKYFDKSIKNTSQQGTKQAMNFLIKSFKNDQEIFKEFQKYRRQMDRQYNVGLNNIHNLLNKISNG
ncbi:hypothetical protein FW781_05265 (plasmid) [Chryseobacterium panacisoli]|uniref:Uncharacterized protein n=1 Tax=Chryseobacterium panacisoli TaxID=1807141 RepID=A0A5D8ZWN8_9FLAO|nr:hypothetical protein [Chryseobacterium panacisoli]TZF99338.1 hypothetical protein FW781_05265 [Chryseobacterium panacisoli]